MTLRSVLLLHGAGSGPWVFAGWQEAFVGVTVVAPDLQSGGDVATTGMADYAVVVAEAATDLPRPLAVVGWSMGGLVAMMAASEVLPEALVVIEPSPPLETAGARPDIEPRPGVYDPAEVYGVVPERLRPRPESWLARGERKRGIAVPALPCPMLVVFGQDFPETRGRAVAVHYGAAMLDFPALSHSGLVAAPEVRAAIAAHLDDVLG